MLLSSLCFWSPTLFATSQPVAFEPCSLSDALMCFVAGVAFKPLLSHASASPPVTGIAHTTRRYDLRSERITFDADDLREEPAALTIQRIFRGYRYRKDLYAMHWAAKKIGTLWWGHDSTL
jgi:hypothetical protein